MIDEIIDIFKKEFSFVLRDDNTTYSVLSNPNNTIFTECDKNGNLIGFSVVYKNTIYLLWVKKEFRKRGIGSKLLTLSEEHIRNNGYKEITIGVNDSYLMPGVPTNKKELDILLGIENIFADINNEAVDFLKKRGYFHSWQDANCFDMILDLKTFTSEVELNKPIDGVNYEWAKLADLPSIVSCTDDAEASFTKWYLDERLYSEDSCKRVLVAKIDDEVVGTLIVNFEGERKDFGCVGCTTVKHAYRGRHIATNMVKIGTSLLKKANLSNAHLGYTYTGLDKMYGYSGYKVCVYYFMAKKYL